MSTSTGRAVDATAAIAFRLRVQRLEAILQGNSKVAADALNVNSGTAVRDIQDNDFRSLSRRLVDVDEALSQAIASSGHEGLKRFVNRFESYSPLLFPTASSPYSSSFGIKDEGDADAEQVVSADDLVPLETKRELVLAFEQDLIEAERLLRDVQVMEQRDVAGAGQLAASDELFAQLRSLQATQRTAQAAFDKRQQRLNAILSACDSQADTMSRLFLEAHAQVSELEARVTRAERAKRKELSETY